MNYLIINGKKSLEIQGLMIQSLPPITKPIMRHQVNEIDGRDGDIVIPLGFKAYDRPVKIGLTRYYDVDDVLEYFNTDGKVIFSNEPYRIYDFSMLDSIELKRLLRFKEATVNFHCQPFKHSAIEFPLQFTGEPVSQVMVKNEGNYFSKPTMTIHGTGNITLKINGVQILSIELGSEGYIQIDAEQMEAFKGNVLKNRLVQGDYNKVILEKGLNLIEFTGDVSIFKIEKYSRWI